MFVVKGHKIEKISLAELASVVEGFDKVVVDLGTGDGKFVYKNALKNPNVFYIGIDPSQKQLEVSARDVQRKKLKNILLVLASIEKLPEELIGLVDEVFVNFPWGSLLETFAKPIEENLKKVEGILRKGGRIQVILGYNEGLEPTETGRLGLSELSNEYIEGILQPKYAENGLKIEKFGRLEEFDNKPKMAETSWKKRLVLGSGVAKSGSRNWYFLDISKR